MSSPIVARSRVMRELVAAARRYAAADGNVLLTGETGTGKDVLARFLHTAGPRADEPFVVVTCGGLPSSLVESELFGHERGAFTDATSTHQGRLESAGAGTIYLDGVGALSPDAQAALLRAVEDKRITRLGGSDLIEIRARIVASAGADLDAAVQDGRFRVDLYHRLRVLPMVLPPLRERRDDILPLTRQLVSAAALRLGRTRPTISPAAGRALRRYWWPGNVRELQSTIERALLDGTSAVIDVADLPRDVLEGHSAYLEPDGPRRPTLEEVERRYIEIVMLQARGSQTDAARLLGISRKTLWEKRKRYGMA